MTDSSRRSGRTPRASVRHGARPRRGVVRGILAFLGITVAVTLVAGASVAAIAVWRIGDEVKHNAVDIGGAEKAIAPSIGAYDGGFNILVVGVDNDPTQSVAQYGKRGSATLNDVNILLHVSADHQSATAVSIPRDMILPFPSCTSEDGKHKSAAATGLALNTAYSYGGLKCVVDVVEKASGLEIPFAGVITFDGVVQMSDAVGGVDVCVDKAIKDPYTGLDLPAGHSTIQGATAAAFVRSRHGVGDGSDLGRISSQQVFMSALVRKLKDEGTLGDVPALFKIAQTASTSMKLSTSLADVTTMVSIARALKDIPLEKVVFVQYPGSTGGTGIYAGKVQPNSQLASKMWAALKSDTPIGLDSKAVGEAGGSELDPTATGTTPSTPASGTPSSNPSASSGTSDVISGLKGQNASQQTCAKAYSG
jgi:LCP family protein required for cell wall assembly